MLFKAVKPEVLSFSGFLVMKLYLDIFSDSAVGLDHVRVHPKFLHSNATSHKWALGGKHVCLSI